MTSAASTTTGSATTTSRTALNITLWVLQVLLACFFVMVGYSHALMPFDQVAQQATWMNDMPRWLSRFIGYAEIAGGLGLVIPAATRIAPWLTPLAALGLATIMTLAIPFHVPQRRRQRHLDARADWRGGGLRRLGDDGVRFRSLGGRYCGA
jgi:uncharacterized membrane protein YphA (DoxX/SURF4 family)